MATIRDAVLKDVDWRRNSDHVCMTQFLEAAEAIHTAMCRFDEDHAGQPYLSEALQSALIGAEQCRQSLARRLETLDALAATND